MLSLDNILLISGLLLAAFSVYLFFSTLLKSNEDQQALALASESDEEDSKKKKGSLIQFSKTLVHSLTLQHSQKIKSKKYRRQIKQKITYAGLDKEINEDEFIGLQILWGVMFPCFFAVLNFALQMGYPFPLFIIISAVGIYFPHLHCTNLAKQRQKSIEKELPFVIDLLALSTEAGMDFIGAIQKITDKSPKDSVLAHELFTVLKEIKLGASRSDALSGLENRVKSSELKSFVTMILDADETGASIAKVLKAKSEQMRYERFNKAEQEGAKASQKILFPMILFILPAIMITIFGPIALQFYYGGGSL